MDNLGIKRLHLLISGKVQGVAYRASMRDEALRHGATGWVRNLSDGRVEAVVHGTPAAVGAMLAWCRRGPAGARVDDVIVTQAAARADGDDFIGFGIRR